MITTTCWILWIPTSGGVDVGVEDWVGPPHATATTRTPIASATRLMRPRYPSRQRRTIAETSALCKPLRARVDVEAIAAKEADEGLVEFSRQRDGQAGGRTDGGQQWNARAHRLLDDLVSRAPAHDELHCGGGQAAVEEQPSDHLVDRVVAADVLAQRDDLAIRIEQAGGVETARAFEYALARAELVDETWKLDRIEPGPGREHREVVAKVFDHLRATDSTGRTGQHRALRLPSRFGRQLHVHVIRLDEHGLDLDPVLGLPRLCAYAQSVHVSRRPDDAFREQQAHGKFDVRARRAHHDSERRAVEEELEWLFGDDGIGRFGPFAGRKAADPQSRRRGLRHLLAFGHAQAARRPRDGRGDLEATPGGDPLGAQLDGRWNLVDVDAIPLGDRGTIAGAPERSADAGADHERRPEAVMRFDHQRARSSGASVAAGGRHDHSATVHLPERRLNDRCPTFEPAGIAARHTRQPAAHLRRHRRDPGGLRGRERPDIDDLDIIRMQLEHDAVVRHPFARQARDVQEIARDEWDVAQRIPDHPQV